MTRMNRRQAMAEGKIERLPYVNSTITTVEMNRAKDLVQEAMEIYSPMVDLIALYSMKNARTKNERIAIAAVLSTAKGGYGLNLDRGQYQMPPTALVYQQVEQAEKNLKEGYVNMAFWNDDDDEEGYDHEIVHVSHPKLRFVFAETAFLLDCFVNSLERGKLRRIFVFFKRRQYVLR